ncbi:bifunctional transaldolase/phosoglucose isomerase [Tundrisphaera sp. TA3]|uniref:bifunctional transaldolase/phosoglucose isomerase n=1 Tax=Tundrisphaera sp. TA3 TaxID=3435775 RepID=UPI003EBC356D
MATAPTGKPTTPLAALIEQGTSPWLDDISRQMLEKGELRRLIEEDGLRGMTSNPSIFQKSISDGSEYDTDVKMLVGEGGGLQSIYQNLTVEDIRNALDTFRTVYDQTNGYDGFVSLEVSPYLAHNTEGTIAEGKQLWKLLDRPNAMIKVPGTPEGLPAIEELLFSGINVNVTLLFSASAYEAVARTYIKAIRRRVDAGLPVDKIASVASFFISRIDSEADKRIEAKIKETTDPAAKAKLEAALGKVAIANGKNAYAIFQGLFHGPDFAPLKAKGAKVQRVLWASVGTKNPRYADTLYTAGLIGPETVSTMPRAAYNAFKDHGVASPTLLEGADDAKSLIEGLKPLGIDLDSITDKLLADGVKLFQESFDQLFKAIEDKKAKILQASRIGQTFVLPEAAADAMGKTLRGFDKERVVAKLWAKDASAWKTDADAVKIIDNSLGWLTVTKTVEAKLDELTAFADEIQKAGFKHVLVMGMGGSSLCVEVLRTVSPPVEGRPTLLVLDSTVPATIRRIEAEIDPAKTLFVVASKSGTTTEPSVFYAYFFDLVKKVRGDLAGENFIAITDPGTKMEADAQRDGFRKIFLNPSDIGGRYSALSFFGMVPAALAGLDVKAILEHAEVAIAQCQPDIPVNQNPGASLGATLGSLALAGRDKVTLVTPAPLEKLGLWIEQIIAESTGKEGKGILPVAGEPVGQPEVYGPDRVFVQVHTADKPSVARSPELMALSDAGHPVLDLVMAAPDDLGAEFFRWEVATPLAGRVLGINPFDQPNVQESKDNTKALLEVYKEKGALPEQDVVATFEGLTFVADPGNKDQLLKAAGGKGGRELFSAVLKAHLDRIKPGDYLAITQYFDETPSRDEAILKLRKHLRDALKVATTTGYGPRFLHSTGQLHKGGSDAGVFLQLTADDGADLPIPGYPCGFSTLVKAQALGDFQSLASRNRRALGLHLGNDVEAGLKTLHTLVHEIIGHHAEAK